MIKRFEHSVWHCFLYGVYILIDELFIQGDRRVLATDEWLRVKGTTDIFALGDCATVDQRRLFVCDAIFFTQDIFSMLRSLNINLLTLGLVPTIYVASFVGMIC